MKSDELISTNYFGVRATLLHGFDPLPYNVLQQTNLVTVLSNWNMKQEIYGDSSTFYHRVVAGKTTCESGLTVVSNS